jgi:outer membrane protein assembly factor BamB
LDPETGSEYWQQEYAATSGSVIMTPVQSGDFLFLGGYSNRNLMLELEQNRPMAKTLFRDKPKLGLSAVNVQPFVEGSIMYGVHQSGELMAVEIPSGKRLWQTSQPLSADRPVGSGTTFIVKNDNLFYLFTETGELVIAELDPQGYTELDRAKVIEATNNAFGRPVVWCMPAFANGRMYVRNDKEIISVELTASRL